MLYGTSIKSMNKYLFILALFILIGISGSAQKIIERTPAKQCVQWYENHVELKQSLLDQQM